MRTGLKDTRSKTQTSSLHEEARDEGASVGRIPVEKLLIIIPAFNEADRIGKVLDEIGQEAPKIPILVIDDGSRDATAKVAREHGAQVIPLPYNNGYGVALQTGFRYAVQQGITVAVSMDADGQHDAREIPRLIHEIQKGGVDVVVGSRFLKTDHYKPSFPRRLGMWMFALLATVCTGRKVTDPTSGFQALRGRALRLAASDLYPPDYPDADFLILLNKCGITVREVPVKMRPSPENKSMHYGSKTVYYVFKMLLSIFVILVRQKPERF